jgi:hypothetical protein
MIRGIKFTILISCTYLPRLIFLCLIVAWQVSHQKTRLVTSTNLDVQKTREFAIHLWVFPSSFEINIYFKDRLPRHKFQNISPLCERKNQYMGLQSIASTQKYRQSLAGFGQVCCFIFVSLSFTGWGWSKTKFLQKWSNSRKTLFNRPTASSA